MNLSIISLPLNRRRFEYRSLRAIYRFLGSIKFAVPLFIIALVLVAVGTFIEGMGDSHELATNWIYGTTYFNLLLSLFFVNILVSALHRIPWKKRHVPFLLTHLGLLMVIGGTMAKNLFGLQGHMILWEGSSSNALLLTNTEALVLKEIDPKNPLKFITHVYPLDRKKPSGFSEGPYQLVSYAKGCETTLEGFIKKEGVKLLKNPFLPRQGLDGYTTTKLPCGLDAACVETDDIEAAIEGRRNTLLFLDTSDVDLFVAIGPKGERFIQQIDVGAYNAYGRGLGGYTVELDYQGLKLESPLTERINLTPKKGRPAMVVELFNKEKVALAYDPTGEAIEWPVMNQTHLASFQPKRVELPESIRLLKAHKSYYPGTSNVESYTAKIESGKTVHTLEMNRVYESKEGYRFYLSNLIGEEGERKSVQLTVNYDPFRYTVTYPGALLLALGMLLLFLPKKKKS